VALTSDNRPRRDHALSHCRARILDQRVDLRNEPPWGVEPRPTHYECLPHQVPGAHPVHPCTSPVPPCTPGPTAGRHFVPRTVPRQLSTRDTTTMSAAAQPPCQEHQVRRRSSGQVRFDRRAPRVPWIAAAPPGNGSPGPSAMMDAPETMEGWACGAGDRSGAPMVWLAHPVGRSPRTPCWRYGTWTPAGVRALARRWRLEHHQRIVSAHRLVITDDGEGPRPELAGPGK
jgi:hypothetical protein